jgi:hypothetical protein
MNNFICKKIVYLNVLKSDIGYIEIPISIIKSAQNM